MIDNIDLPLPEIEWEGKNIRLTHGVYGIIMHSENREKRREAYEKYYYYVSNQKSISIKIISNQIQYLKIELLSDTGNSIPCQIQKKQKHTVTNSFFW